MKINYKKILSLNKRTITKYINKPLYNNNYIFHYYILLNNLSGLKLTKYPIYNENDDGLNGIHLAAKMNNIDILLYLIKTYPDYIYNKNTLDHTFIYYLSEKSLIKVINFSKKLNWNYLISTKLLKSYFKNFSFNNILIIIKLLKIDNINKYLYNIIYNDNITTKNKIKIFDNFNDTELNIKNSLDGGGLLLDSLFVNNKELFDYFIKHNIDYNYYTIIKAENPFRIGINIDIITNNKYYSSILLKKYINNKHDFNYELNKYGDNIIHSLLYIRNNRLSQIDISNYDKTDYTIDTDIINYCNNSIIWNQLNNDKISSFELIVNLNYNIYSKYINCKITQENKDKLNKLNINEDWLKFINKLDIYYIDDNINITNLPYVHYTLFQARFYDLSLFMLYLSEKHKDLYVPIIDLHLIENIKGDEMLFTDNIIAKNQIFPWYISYINENEYYIHEYLNNIIKGIIKENNKKYAIIFLSRNYISTLHANILFYDFTKMTIERFEPYGNIELSNIDDILEEELTWDTRLRYIRPKEFLKNVGFQTLSDENYILNQKPGDFGGFCLAWCIWYIETRICNINIEPKILVNKLITKLNNTNIKFSEYIRNYSNKINNYRIQYLLDIGIDSKMTSNLYYDNKTENKLTNFIIKKYDI